MVSVSDNDKPAGRVIGPAAPGVTAVEIDGRFSIYNPTSTQVLTLNETASDVWRLCDGEADATGIVASIAAAYGEPAAAITESVLDTIKLFADEGLLVPTQPDTTSP